MKMRIHRLFLAASLVLAGCKSEKFTAPTSASSVETIGASNTASPIVSPLTAPIDWSDSIMVDLMQGPFAVLADKEWVYPTSISTDGETIGIMAKDFGDNSIDGYVWSAGMLTKLQRKYSGYSVTSPVSVNSRGQALISYSSYTEVSYNVWQNGSLIPVRSPCNVHYPQAISEDGIIVGAALRADCQTYSPATWANGEYKDGWPTGAPPDRPGSSWDGCMGENLGISTRSVAAGIMFCDASPSDTARIYYLIKFPNETSPRLYPCLLPQCRYSDFSFSGVTNNGTLLGPYWIFQGGQLTWWTTLPSFPSNLYLQTVGGNDELYGFLYQPDGQPVIGAGWVAGKMARFERFLYILGASSKGELIGVAVQSQTTNSLNTFSAARIPKLSSVGKKMGLPLVREGWQAGVLAGSNIRSQLSQRRIHEFTAITPAPTSTSQAQGLFKLRSIRDTERLTRLCTYSGQLRTGGTITIGQEQSLCSRLSNASTFIVKNSNQAASGVLSSILNDVQNPKVFAMMNTEARQHFVTDIGKVLAGLLRQ